LGHVGEITGVRSAWPAIQRQRRSRRRRHRRRHGGRGAAVHFRCSRCRG
jgi:hypothetical protein